MTLWEMSPLNGDGRKLAYNEHPSEPSAVEIIDVKFILDDSKSQQTLPNRLEDLETHSQ
jgi:hypothetical protein